MSLTEFAKTTLQINCWPKMEEIFQAVEAGERKILIRSCNGAGKTTALAAICNWYFSTYPDSIVLTTASSWIQVKQNLWGEIKRQAREAKLYKDPNDKRKPMKLHEAAIHLTDKHFMIGISPDLPENAMGFHAPHILIAVDEATGVSRDIMTALTGNLTGANAQMVLICNPIDHDSYAYDAEQSGQWRVIHISAFDHPNVIENNDNIPGAVSRTWVLDRLKAWSFEVSEHAVQVGDAIYIQWLERWFRLTSLIQTRILGDWSTTEHFGFIPLELINRHVRPKPKFQFETEPPVTTAKVRALGVDVARGVGEDATVYAFFDVHDDGPDVQLPFQQFYNHDLMSTADHIQHEYEACKAKGIELIIAIDDTGVGGGVTDKLKREAIPVFPVNFCQKPKGFIPGKPMANARAEMYFLLNAEIHNEQLELYDHKRFHQELSSIRLDISKTNDAYKMEDKTLTRQRLGRSPDFADATALARYALRLWKHAKIEKLL